MLMRLDDISTIVVAIVIVAFAVVAVALAP
jgi:hypothetical protein